MHNTPNSSKKAERISRDSKQEGGQDEKAEGNKVRTIT